MSSVRSNGWWKHPDGYIQGRVWEGKERRIVLQHRYVMEQEIGRRLLRSEDVHHINGDKTNNRPENLELLTHGKHSSLTGKQRPRPWTKGVCWSKSNRNWYGAIKRDGVKYLTISSKDKAKVEAAYVELKNKLEGR